MRVYSNGCMEIQSRPLQGRPIAFRNSWIQTANHRFLERFNKQPHNAAVQRVVCIVELLLSAEQLRIEIYKAHFSQGCDENCKEHRYTSAKIRNKPRTGYTFRDPAINRMNRQYEQCLIELEKRLRRYRSRPAIVNFDYLKLEEVPVFGAKDDEKQWENSAVPWILSIAQTGFMLRPSKLSRLIRRCGDCSQWFAAKMDHQHFCGEACRKHYASQSPEFKAKRRDYMRERYRPMQMEAEQRSLRNAGIKAKGRK